MQPSDPRAELLRGAADLLRLAALLAVAVVVGLWLLSATLDILLLLVFVVVLAIALNDAVTALTERGVRRGIAVAVVLGAVVAVVVGFVVLIGPRLVDQGVSLVERLPEYADRLLAQVERLTGRAPGELMPPAGDAIRQVVPSLADALGRAAGYSVTVVTGVILLVVLLTMVVYALLEPRPLLRAYLHVFPERWRPAASATWIEGARAVSGWVRANVIVGGIEGVVAAVALTLLGVPGALLWGAFTFFAELVPRVGSYLMAIPPTLVALAVDPLTALWVVLLYVVLQNGLANVVAPKVRSHEMDLHPVFLMSILVTFTAAFGIVGALIATPVAGFLRAGYRSFFLEPFRRPPDEAEVDRLLHDRPPDGDPTTETTSRKRGDQPRRTT